MEEFMCILCNYVQLDSIKQKNPTAERQNLNLNLER